MTETDLVPPTRGELSTDEGRPVPREVTQALARM